MLTDGAEIALLDVREEMTFGAAHILYASSMPLSRLELLAPLLAPRRSARVVVCGDLVDDVQLAARRLTAFGYSNVAVLDDGIDGWRAAGFELFADLHVPSKSFGEWVEHRDQTPSISADELAEKIANHEDMVVLDSRPWDEYVRRSIPTGICVPGGELAYRVHDLAPSPDTLVVVNCAGRTRSIIGAQSLINAGIANSVVALRNGTMGWRLAGHQVVAGADRSYDELSATGLEKALAVAARVAQRFGVKRIDRETLASWREQQNERTLFVLDVRSPGEYQQGHLPGSWSAPGGQLVQETERYAGTLGARIVLVDDTGVRATMAASWLLQMGHAEVVILPGVLEQGELEQGVERVQVLGLDDVVAPAVSPAELALAQSREPVTVIDVGFSRAYQAGHIAGAAFAIRARLDDALAHCSPAGMLVFTSEDGIVARLAAGDVDGSAGWRVHYLAGGNQAWLASGLPVTVEGPRMLSDAIDIWRKPYDKDWGVQAAMQDYLDWEVGLVAQLERDQTVRFPLRT